MLRILATIAPPTALSRSASGQTMNGALPPSSIDVRITVRDACSSSNFPTWVDPVKLTLRARPLSIHVSTTEPGSSVVTTFSTPAGKPASVRISVRASVVSGVSSAGLNTMVQPAAIAGPILRVPIASGKFHGVMRMHGPTGSFVTRMRFAPSPVVV